MGYCHLCIEDHLKLGYNPFKQTIFLILNVLCKLCQVEYEVATYS